MCYLTFSDNTIAIEISEGEVRNSSVLLIFYYLAPLLNDCLVTSQCTQFTFGDKREICRPVRLSEGKSN